MKLTKDERAYLEKVARLAPERLKGVSEDMQDLETPLIDPVEAAVYGATFGGAAGIKAGMKIGPTALKALYQGGLSAAADYPAGLAVEQVAEKHPVAAIPVAIATGGASEALLGKGISKSLSSIRGAVGPAKKPLISHAKPTFLQTFEEQTKEVFKDPVFLRQKIGSRTTKYLGDDASRKVVFQSLYDFDLQRMQRIRATRTWDESDYKALELAADQKRMHEILNLPKGATPDDIGIRAIEFRWVDSVSEFQEMLGRHQVNPTDLTVMAKMQQAQANMGLWTEQFQWALGQSGRSLRGTARVAPETMMLKDLIQKAGGPFRLQEWSADVAKAFRMVDITDMDAMLQFVQKLPTPEASVWDKIFFVVQNNWLSGLATQGRNILGNTSMTLSKFPESAIGAGVDYLLKSRSGKRSVYLGETGSMALGVATGIKQAVPGMFKHFLDTMSLQPLDVMYKTTKFDDRGFPIKGKAGEFIGAPMKFLTMIDEATKCVVGNMTMNSLAYNQAMQEGLRGKAFTNRVEALLKSPTKKMRNLVADEQVYRTFQKEGGELTKAIMRLRTSFHPMKYVFPFVTTPANILKAAAERAPVFSEAVLYHRWKRGDYKGWTKSFTAQRQLSQDISKLVLGHLMAGYFVNQFVEGKITGKVPESPGGRELWRAGGLQEYSYIAEDGRVIPITKILQEPYSLVLEGTINAIENKMTSGEDLTPSEVGVIGLKFAENIADRSFLRGAADLANALSNTDRAGTRYFERIGTWFVPYGGFLASITHYKDPYYRKTEGSSQAVQARLPGMSQDLPVSRDPLGRPRKRQGTAFQRAFAPFQITRKKTDIVTGEMTRLFETKGFALTFPPDSLQSKRLGLTKEDQMDPQDYLQFLESQGQVIQEALLPLFQNQGYGALSDDQKIDLIRNTASKARDAVRNQERVRYLLKKKGLSRP
jgi:hypothetical protein